MFLDLLFDFESFIAKIKQAIRELSRVKNILKLNYQM